MDIFFNFLRSDIFLSILFLAVIVLFLLYITSVINLKKLRVSYKKFMNKLGNGENFDEILKEYVKKVNTVEAKKVGAHGVGNCTGAAITRSRS